ncbi:MAG: FliM/FliN family flagellar motor switch protein [Acidobacteriota bacterium]|nr:FliM/FliN family flagellar motor switch protein [Acidobacteriota bacterium]
MEQWTGKLVLILESMTDQRPAAVWDTEGEPPDSPGISGASLVWAQSLSGWTDPVIWIAAPDPTWQDLGGRTLRAAGVEEIEEADARNTWLEVLNQSLSGLAKELSRRLEREVVCERGDECTGALPDAEFIALRIDYGDAELPPLLVAFSPVLLQALGPVPGKREEGAGEASSDDREIPAGAPGLQRKGISKTFDLLLEVGLPVSISFGRTQLPIRDVLKLTTGSIVELNRTVLEPVEVVINDCVIARGEVVVVEGNYGVRIRQIISREERLRTGTGPAQRAQKGATAMERAGSQG